MPRFIAITAIVLILTGCSLSLPRPTIETDAATPTPPPTEAEAPTDVGDPGCIAVSDGAIAGLQWGFDDKQPGFTVVQAAGYDVPEWDSLTLVAAEFTGPGIESQVALWATQADVTTATDAAYNSIDFVAAEFTSYLRPPSAPTSLPEFALVKDCLTN
jgi:hypothetical protein